VLLLNSYPYLIQANYRAGYFTHYAGAGTVKSFKISYKGQETDLCLCRTMAKYNKEDDKVIITTNPVTVTLKGLDIVIQSVFTFKENSGEITIERNILNDLKDEEVTFEEYFTGGYGTTEYQKDMSSVVLGVDSETINYSYLGRKVTKNTAKEVYANLFDVNTKVSMSGEVDCYEAEEGIAFSPVYRLSLKKKLSKGGMKTCLKLQKVN